MTEAVREGWAYDAVDRDEWDDVAWTEIAVGVPVVAELEDRLVEAGVDDPTGLLRDVTLLFLQARPRIRDVREMQPQRRGVRDIVDAVFRLDQTAVLRQRTCGDQYGAALALVAVSESLLGMLADPELGQDALDALNGPDEDPPVPPPASPPEAPGGTDEEKAADDGEDGEDEDDSDGSDAGEDDSDGSDAGEDSQESAESESDGESDGDPEDTGGEDDAGAPGEDDAGAPGEDDAGEPGESEGETEGGDDAGEPSEDGGDSEPGETGGDSGPGEAGGSESSEAAGEPGETEGEPGSEPGETEGVPGGEPGDSQPGVAAGGDPEVEPGALPQPAGANDGPTAGQRLAQILADRTADGLDDVSEDLDQEARAFAEFGLDPSEARAMDFDARQNAALALGKGPLAKFARLFGRFRAFAAARAARRVEFAREEAVGIELGKDPTVMIASELALMGNPLLRRDLFIRLAEGRALVRAFKGHDIAGRGPVVICVDGSWSMTTTDENGISREAWSKAIVLAVIEACKLSSRDVDVIHFAGAGQHRLWRFPGAHVSPLALVEMIGHFFKGSTDFATPIDLAVTLVHDHKERQGGADILLVTDGEAKVSDRWLKAHQEVKDELGFRVWGIGIGMERPGGTLQVLSDDVRVVSDLSDPAVAGDLFAGVA